MCNNSNGNNSNGGILMPRSVIEENREAFKTVIQAEVTRSTKNNTLYTHIKGKYVLNILEYKHKKYIEALTNKCAYCKYFFEKDNKREAFICNSPNQVREDWTAGNLWDCEYPIDSPACSEFESRDTDFIPKININQIKGEK